MNGAGFVLFLVGFMFGWLIKGDKDIIDKQL